MSVELDLESFYSQMKILYLHNAETFLNWFLEWLSSAKLCYMFISLET